jgi:hypothetical protein
MSVLQLALAYLEEQRNRELVSHVPNHREWDSGTSGTPGTVGQVGQRDSGTDHRCSSCGQPARLGYGVRLRHGEEGRWFCAAHRPEAAKA